MVTLIVRSLSVLSFVIMMHTSSAVAFEYRVQCPTTGQWVDKQERCALFLTYSPDNSVTDPRVLERIRTDHPDATQVRSIALILAVSKYNHLGANNSETTINSVENDVKNLRRFFMVDQKFDEVILITNNDITNDNIDFFMDHYLVDRNFAYKRLVVAFTGHGFQSGDKDLPGYLALPEVADLTDTNNAYSLAVLKAKLDILSGKKGYYHVLLLLNACYAGSVFGVANQGYNDSTFGRGAWGITAGPSDTEVRAVGGDDAGSVFFDSFITKIRAGTAERYDQELRGPGGAVILQGGITTFASAMANLTHEMTNIAAANPDLNIKPPWEGSIMPLPGRSEGAIFFLSPSSSAIAAGTAVPISFVQRSVPSGPVSSVPGHPELKVFNPPEDYPIRGIDIAAPLSRDDWTIAKNAGANFAYVAANKLLGDSVSNNFATLTELKIPHGAYILFDFCASPQEQGDNLRGLVSPNLSLLPIAVSVERYDQDENQRKCAGDIGAARKLLHSFLSNVEKDYFKTPIIYANANSFRELINNEFDRYPIWLARWGNEKGDARALSGGNPWTIWQYREGLINKVGADFDVFFGTRENFDQFMKGGGNPGLMAVQPQSELKQ